MICGLMRRGVLPAALAASLAAGSAACSSQPPVSTGAVIHADKPVALADQRVHLTVDGLAPRDTVTVSSSATAADGTAWSAHATFESDEHGVIDLAQAKPESGTYHTADGMGLFWSMGPANGDPEASWFYPTSDRKSVV